MCRDYADFVRTVAKGRGMSYEAVHKVAKGRLWTGQQALERGLVDQLGGLHDAISLAKQLAGLPLVQFAYDIVAHVINLVVGTV